MDQAPPSGFERAGRRRKSDALAEAIADAVLRSGLSPGDRLPIESEMVSQYGVGRASLREALRILEAQGVIDIRVGSGGGAFVAPPSHRLLARSMSILFRFSDVGLRDVLEARIAIEPALAARAARHRSGAQLEDLQRNVEHLCSLAHGEAEWRRCNRQFHTLLAEAAHNRSLAVMWQALSLVADGHAAGVRYPPDALQHAARAHRKIVAAVAARDAALAHEAMATHLRATLTYVSECFPHLLESPIAVVPDGDRSRSEERR